MAQLDKDDLKQMNRSYFQSLSQERLVEVADNLHILATELWEKQQQNSENSSQPPSKDNPYSSNYRVCFSRSIPRNIHRFIERSLSDESHENSRVFIHIGQTLN